MLFKLLLKTHICTLIRDFVIKNAGKLNFNKKKQGGEKMCGIVGYIGKKKAEPILINGLLRLEYRGYDSAGIATIEKERNKSNKE